MLDIMTKLGYIHGMKFTYWIFEKIITSRNSIKIYLNVEKLKLPTITYKENKSGIPAWG